VITLEFSLTPHPSLNDSEQKEEIKEQKPVILFFITDEIVLHVIQFLTPNELGRAALVCRSWAYLERNKASRIFKHHISNLSADKFRISQAA
jgi:hypothetical protein